ncbi:MAG: hypothetical protein FWE88_08655 [Phycisphaerae bacterium]|nr:hypothetical protein [Phycisphaerae bacterium]
MSVPKWMWTSATKPNQYVGAVREFDLSAVPESAVLRVFADSEYKLYVNGRFVNAGPAPFAKPVIPVDAYDVASLLRPGGNEIFVLACSAGVDTKRSPHERPGMYVLFEATLPGGQSVRVVSDDQWRVADLDAWASDTPRIVWARGFVEDFHADKPSAALLARHAPDDYAVGTAAAATAEADAASLWQSPTLEERADLTRIDREPPILRWCAEDAPAPRIWRGNPERYLLALVPRLLQHEHVVPEWDARQARQRRRDGSVVLDRRRGEQGFALAYDFGRQMAGHLAFEIDSPCAATVDLVIAESASADGRPFIALPSGATNLTRVRLQPGVNRFRGFGFWGFRYVYLSLKDFEGVLTVRRLTVHRCRADVDYQDRFVASSRAAEAVYDIGRRAIKTGAQAACYDCNTREQGMYWGDGIWVADMVAHMTGDFRHWTALNASMARDYAAKGAVPASAYGMGGPLIDYCLVAVESLRRHYRCTGNLDLLASQHPTAERVMDDFRRSRDGDGWVTVAGLIKQTPYKDSLLFLDHQGMGWHPRQTTGHDRRDPNAGLNLFYLQALEANAEIRRALGLSSDDEAAAEIAFLRPAIRRKFYDEAVGALRDALDESHPAKPGNPTAPEILSDARAAFSQLVNALAASLGVLTPAEARYALRLVTDTASRPWISAGSPYSWFYLAQAWAVQDRAAEGMAAITRAFTPMLERGATATWECFGGDNHDTMNHAWSAIAPWMMIHGVLGAAPASPGYAALSLRLALDTFDRLDYAFRLPAGPVTATWTRQAPHRWHVELHTPPGMPVQLTWTATGREGATAKPFEGRWSGTLET